MAKFFKQLFTSTSANEDKKKNSRNKNEPVAAAAAVEENKEFSAPYDTRRKLTISRSGRMKQNLKARGALGNDLFGQPTVHVEKTNIEYHVHGKQYTEIINSSKNCSKRGSTTSADNFDAIETNLKKIKLNSHNLDEESKRSSSIGNMDMDKEIENAFKIVETAF